MALQVKAILQTQGAEFIFREFTRDAAFHLASELCNAFTDDLVVVLVVAIHDDP
jgi:hypothetical protein